MVYSKSNLTTPFRVKIKTCDIDALGVWRDPKTVRLSVELHRWFWSGFRHHHHSVKDLHHAVMAGGQSY